MEAITTRSTDSETLLRIVSAARRTYRQRGAAKTRMAHVAEAAGMARQTLYKFVSGRPELMELALAARMGELGELVVDRVGDGDGDLAESMVDCLAVMAEVFRDDQECAEIIAAMDPADAFRFMTGPTAAQGPALQILEPLHERLSADLLLEPRLSLEETAWWARTVLAPLSARRDLDAEALRSLIRRFVLPALIRGA